NSPAASATAAGGQPSDGAIAMAEAMASSRVRSTTITGRSSANATDDAVDPLHRSSTAPLGSSTVPSSRPTSSSSESPATTHTPHTGPRQQRAHRRGPVLSDRGRRGTPLFRTFLPLPWVLIATSPRLTAEPARCHEGPLVKGRGEPGVVAERLPY